jgi:uncharacterized membrane protein YeaQ/YmgE (transglycosylase-associated protein family)
MLSKLIKYDIRSTWRDFAGVYMAILLGVIIAPLLFNHVDTEITDMIASFLITSIVIATIVIMIVNLFKIFNTNVFSKQGYLTMTLPVTSQHIVLSKLIVSMMWIICTGIVSVIGVFIFLMILNPLPYASLAAVMEKISWFLDNQGYLAVALIILSMIASAVKEIAKLFLACSIAHLKQLNRFRVPVAILSYFVLSWLEALIIQAIGEILNFIPYTGDVVRQLNRITDITGLQDFIGLFNGVLVVGILYALLLSFAFSIGTVWILNHKLDLE